MNLFLFLLLLCYVNKELASKCIPHKSIVVDNLLECITIELMISGHKNVIVSCLYSTPGYNTNYFSEILYDLFSELSVSKTIFICGDFNLDIVKHNSNHATQYFLDTMYSLGLYPLIDRPSRITNHSSTLIDNIFTNAKEYNNVSGLLVNDITDHLPIFAFCDYPNLKRQEKKLYTKKRVINKNTIDLLLISYQK